MYDGIITINVDPPYISLSGGNSEELKTLSQEQLRSFLAGLGLKHWPLVDGLIRISGQVSVQALTDLGLLSQAKTDAIH